MVLCPHYGVAHEQERIVPGISAILYDPDTGLYGFLQDEKNPHDLWMVAGGMNAGETSYDCLLRELREETGYIDIKDAFALWPLLHTHYYHPKKKIYGAGQVRPFLVVLRSLQQVELALEEHEKDFVLTRVPMQALYESLAQTGTERYGAHGYQHWIDLAQRAEQFVQEELGGIDML